MPIFLTLIIVITSNHINNIIILI